MKSQVRAAFYRTVNVNMPSYNPILADTRKSLAKFGPCEEAIGVILSTGAGNFFKQAGTVLTGKHIDSLLEYPEIFDLLGREGFESLLFSTIMLAKTLNSHLEEDVANKSIQMGFIGAEIGRRMEGISPVDAYLATLMSGLGAITIGRFDKAYLSVYHRKNLSKPFSSESFMVENYLASLPVYSAVLCHHWRICPIITKSVFLQNRELGQSPRKDANKIRSLIAAINLARYVYLSGMGPNMVTDDIKLCLKRSRFLIKQPPKSLVKDVLDACSHTKNICLTVVSESINGHAA